MPEDVFKILKDLELRAVGLDEQTSKMQEGYFISFRSVGLPIPKADFDNPWSPLGVNLEKDIPKTDPQDPANAPKTGSGKIDANKLFTANIAKSQQSYLNGFLLTDDKLQMNSQYAVMPGSSKLSDTWWAIITGANGIPTQSVLSDAMKKAYDDATAKLMDKDGNPTPHYQAYMQYQEKYHDKVRAWNRAYANAFADPMKLENWPLDGKLYHDDADEAMDQWASFGFKQEIESAIATLAAQGIDPAIALIARAKKRFTNSLNEFTGIGEFPYTLMLPNSWYDDLNDEGWSEYTSNDFHAETHYQASSTSYGGGGGFSIGFWTVGGDFSHTDSRSSLNIQTQDLEIAFKYCVVDVKRPWLDTSLLNLQNWFLMGNYKKNCISSGSFDQELPSDRNLETIFLPSVVTSLVLIKDLNIRWATLQEDFAAHSEFNSAAACVGYGPFFVSGSYSHQDQKNDFTCDMDGATLAVHGIQLVGYVSMIVPPSPGVDSAQYLAKPAGAGG